MSNSVVTVNESTNAVNVDASPVQVVEVSNANVSLTNLRPPSTWSSSVTYAANEWVKGSDNVYYFSLVNSNLNHNPVGDGGVHWQPQTPNAVLASSFLTPTGSDDSVQINSAISGACVIVLGQGTFLLNTSTIHLPSAATKIIIRGMGRGRTIVKLSSTAPRAFDLFKVTDYEMYQNIEIEDLTVDCNSINGALGDHVILGYGATGTLRFSAKNIRLRRIDAINIPTDASQTTSNRRAFKLYPVLNSGDSAVSVTDVIVEDCRAFGGNTGFITQGYYPSGTSPITIDDIHFRRLYHDTGIAPSAFFASNNFQIGGNATVGHIEMSNCWGRGCGDAGIEVDGADEALVSDCLIEDSFNSAFLATNFQPSPHPNAQKYIFQNCHGKRTRIAHGGGFLIVGNSSIAVGRVFIRGCSWYKNSTDTFGMFGINTADGILVQNLALQSISISDFDYSTEGVVYNDPTTGSFMAGIQMDGLSANTIVSMRGIKARMSASRTGVAAMTWGFCRFSSTGTIDIDVDGINVSFDITGSASFSHAIFNLGFSSSHPLTLGRATFNDVQAHTASDDAHVSGFLIGSATVSPILTINSQISVNNFDCSVFPSTGHPFRFADAGNQTKISVLNSYYPSGPFSSTQFLAPSNYKLVVLADLMDSYWRLDESSGATSAIDISGGGNNGTYVNSPSFGATSLINGDINTAVTFISASSQKLTLPGPALTTDGTIEAWFKWTAGSTLMRDNTSTGGYIIGFDSSGTFAIRMNATTINTSLATTAVRDGNKHHMVVTFTGGTAICYVDGVSVGSGSYTNTTSPVTPWHVSENGLNAQYSDTTFDEVAIATRALSASRVKAHYNIGH